jgi:Rps23 Pro-64 3,4-dihydroxylase Tpa1-like proline 4-hydroxylase
MTDNGPAVEFAPRLDLEQLARVYARCGRIHIPAILELECAQAAYRSLHDAVPWQLHFNDAGRVYDLFDNFPLSDAYANSQHHGLYVMRILEFLNSPRFLDFARRLTAEPRIAFADAQATLYRSGHFLTEHDDAIDGQRRLAAYVLNLTPRWRADWGGLLLFLDRDGHVAEGYTPTFNALNIFKVPQPHAVTCVAPFAAGGRYSISGWLRES